MSGNDAKGGASKRAGRHGRRFLRPGLVLPLTVFLLGLGDAGSRLLPLEAFAIRTWDVASVSPAPGGHFVANRRFEVPRAWGDLANLGNRLELRELRREVLTTDGEGFRTRRDVMGIDPADAVLIGDSFAGGCGLSDEETLAAQLHALTGRGVYNAAGRLIANGPRIEELAKRHLAPAGWLLVVRVSPAPMPRVEFGRAVAPIPRARDDGADEPVRGDGIGVSRLAIVLSRARRWAEAGAGVGRSPDVIVRGLPGGRRILLRTDPAGMAPPLPSAVVDSWTELAARLGKGGHRVLFVLVPQKTTVYGPLVRPKAAEADALRRGLDGEARALASRGLDVLDLTDGLEAGARSRLESGGLVYWRDDTHWNPEGVRIAAVEVARALAWPPRAATPGR